MGRISRTVQLARASWEVLKADKELIALPLLSLLSTLVVAASFLIPMAWVGRAETEQNPAWVILPLAFLAYLVLAYITIFFNAALVHAANQRLEGGDPTVGSAVRGAASRAGRLFPWALLSATVSALLRALEERAGTLGKVISGIAGMAWSLVTFLVIPILVIEDLRVGDALRRSTALFKGTWGENVAARVGFGLLGFLAVLPGIAAIAGAVALGDPVNPLLLTIGVVWILTVAMVLSALSGIFQTALYRYAAGLPNQGAFASNDLRTAFGAK
ncbi:MAG: DUF6159 family protein [Actinomycetota bacterium]